MRMHILAMICTDNPRTPTSWCAVMVHEEEVLFEPTKDQAAIQELGWTVVGEFNGEYTSAGNGRMITTRNGDDFFLLAFPQRGAGDDPSVLHNMHLHEADLREPGSETRWFFPMQEEEPGPCTAIPVSDNGSLFLCLRQDADDSVAV